MKKTKKAQTRVQTAPVRRGEVYEICIDRLGTSGEGVGRYENFTVFVPNALPGERVTVRMEEVKTSYARGRLTEILQQSNDRITPLCSLYEECGGCQLQHLSYAAQLRAKRQQVIDALSHIGKLPHVSVRETLAAQSAGSSR